MTWRCRSIASFRPIYFSNTNALTVSILHDIILSCPSFPQTRYENFGEHRTDISPKLTNFAQICANQV